MKNKTVNLLVVLGPTASGKTSLAVELAKKYNGEILSADSRQVYRGLDIGSGKDLHEYGDIPYHLIDIVDPDYEYSVYDFQQHFIDAFNDVVERKKLPILAGGTGLYLDAILKNYRMVQAPENPELRKKLLKMTDADLLQYLFNLKTDLHNSTDTEERPRLVRAIEIAAAEKEAEKNSSLPDFPHISPCILGIQWQREKLRARITQRLKQRLDSGLIEEVERLHQQGVSWQTLDFYGLEYRFVAQYLQGSLNKNDMYQKLNSAIHQFAKKQDTWFRRLEKNGFTIHWLNGEKDLLAQAEKLLTNIEFEA